MLIRHTDGLGAVLCDQQLVAAAAKHIADERSHCRVVLDDKNCFGTAFARSSMLRERRLNRSRRRRKIHQKLRSFADFALDENMAAALLDDAIDGGQAESSASMLF